MKFKAGRVCILLGEVEKAIKGRYFSNSVKQKSISYEPLGMFLHVKVFRKSLVEG